MPFDAISPEGHDAGTTQFSHAAEHPNPAVNAAVAKIMSEFKAPQERGPRGELMADTTLASSKGDLSALLAEHGFKKPEQHYAPQEHDGSHVAALATQRERSGPAVRGA